MGRKRAGVDPPLLVVMFGLMALRQITPSGLRALEVARTKNANFAGATAGEALKLNHRTQHRREMRDYRPNHIIRYGTERARLASRTAILGKTNDRHEGLVGLDRNEFVLHAQSKHPTDAAYVLIDHAAAIVGLEHCRPHRL